ncbi:hypothetical protein GCM10010965_29680 [Caldalkalibacillus thermarum]|uniref:hypothetical protein n=1 Tax=Caldalkalibacillus thermarum TaxID=296745 RepID=UPI00166B04E6|nr:hypothetical protein [Caldalkalibacillus thermarum]GGK34807.1 hypothetical protein GCM10010965_29680 [Caldalkalibacillus thermarum]
MLTVRRPAGIDPEITLKVLQEKECHSIAKPLVVGSYIDLELTREQLGVSVRLNRTERIEDGMFTYGVIDVLDIGEAGKGVASTVSMMDAF